MFPRVRRRADAVYLDQGEDRGGNVAQHPDGRKPARGAQPPRKKKIAGPHQQIADAGECKNAGAGEVVDTVDNAENEPTTLRTAMMALPTTKPAALAP